MKDEPIHRDFVRLQFELLTSFQFDRRRFKEVFNDFYIKKHKKRFSFPTKSELMEVLISILKNASADAEIHQLIDSLPFFRETGERERQRLHELLNGKVIRSTLSDEQLQAIKKVGAYEAISRIKGKQIEDQKHKELDELQKKIDAKRGEYASLPSVLDQEIITDSQYDPKVETKKPWWERFYLRSDPFPRKDGLSAISTDLYEAVIIKTDPFQTTLSNLQQNPNYLFNTGYLLVGDFGFGKTTFVDYLSNYLINRDILPLRITSSRQYADASGFADSFFHKLRMELGDEARKITTVDESALGRLQLEDQVVELCRRVLARRQGIVVFMDDYHKFRGHFSQIFEFLGTLQILKDTLTREGLKVGFIVSGIPSWLDELQRNSQLAGFLDNTPIPLPLVSPELICDVFNKRIGAFCYESTPRRIKPDFVRQLVKELGGELGIRGCLNKIIFELSNNNLAIVDSPLEIPDAILRDVRIMLEGDEKVRSSLNKLLYESRFKRYSNEQIARCFELLVHINVQGGISEGDRQFTENKFHFLVLRDAELIQKQKTNDALLFKWNLSERLTNVVITIFSKHGLNLADYLLKLYAFKGYGENTTTVQMEDSNPLSEAKRFFARRDIKLDKAIKENIAEGLQRVDSLLIRDPKNQPNERLLATGLEALDFLTTSLCALDATEVQFSRMRMTDSTVKWLFHPTATESISEAIQRIHDYHQDKTTTRLSHAIRQLTNALVEIAEKLRSLGEQLFDASDPLLHRPSFHSAEELELFKNISISFYSAARDDHFGYVRRLTDYLELKFRRYFYFAGSLVFGDKYFDNCPKAVTNYAHRNLERRQTFSAIHNLFDGITRSQFRFIFTEGNGLREHCVRNLNIAWKDDDWKTFALVFAVENIKVAHQQIDAFAAQDKLRYRKYASLSEELLSSINEAVASTIQTAPYLAYSGEKWTDPSQYKFRFIFKNVTLTPEEIVKGRVFTTFPAAMGGKEIGEHALNDEAYKRVISALRSKLEHVSGQLVTQDLLDIDYIQTHFRVSIQEFICVMSFVKHVTKELIVEPWFGSSIAIKAK